MANQFSPIRTDDTTLARVQDAIARFLNPLLRLTVKDRLSLNGSGVESNQECWADLSSSPVAGAGAAALTSQPFPEAGAPVYMLCYSHAADETLSYASQMPHAWDRGAVRPHAHVFPLVSPASTQYVMFTLRYAWARYQGVAPALSSWGTRTVLLPVNPGDALRHKIADFGLISPDPQSAASTLFLWSVTRNGTSVGDTYTTNKGWGVASLNVAAASFDLHYQVDRAGTSPEFPEV